MVKSAPVPRPFSLKKKTDAINRKKACIRVFYSLLLICYLEVRAGGTGGDPARAIGRGGGRRRARGARAGSTEADARERAQ